MTPTFWPTSLTTCSVQVGMAKEANIVKRIPGRRIAYAVTGSRMEVFEIPYGLLWARRNLPLQLPGSQEVWGGEWSDFEDFRKPCEGEAENTPQNIE